MIGLPLINYSTKLKNKPGNVLTNIKSRYLTFKPA
jgi:hypothetical protein